MKSKLTFLILLSLFIVNSGHAQNKKRAKKTILKGLVIDTENNPVKNASIFADGRNCKILSDEKGRFKIKIKSNVKTITVFTLAKGATEVLFQGETEMTFILAASEEIIEDRLNAPKKEESDLVNTGYIKAHKRNISTSVGKINKNTIKNSDHYLNIYDMIQGEVAGVSVYGSTIRIRGIGTITGSSTPLFIVNGMPVMNIDHIFPSQVKSISVLKDSSAAIYGIRGANGVIVITLKTVVYD